MVIFHTKKKIINNYSSDDNSDYKIASLVKIKNKLYSKLKTNHFKL